MAGPHSDAETSTVARGTNDRGVKDKDIASSESPIIRGASAADSSTTATSTSTTAHAWQPVFTPGVAHNHQACGRWAEIREKPVTVDLSVDQICRYGSPADVAKRAKQYLGGNPIAIEHLNYYLKGSGRDFNEDVNLVTMLRLDAGVRAALAAEIRRVAPPASKVASGWMMLQQQHYTNEDFLFTFGGIDRFEFEVDLIGKSVRVWFQDRYEWHPVYEGLYDRQSGDRIRDNNCLHAAMVEMKIDGAADFWMKGKAIIPLDSLPSADAKPPAGRPEGWW